VDHVVAPVVNAFSVDVEGFVEANLEGFPAEVARRHTHRPHEDDEIRENTDSVLRLLEGANIRATFFFLGRIARDAPDVVRSVADTGHEIACHGDEHRRLTGMDPSALDEAVRRAKAGLEEVSGQAIIGFRAPDFSITRDSLWAFDILQQAGFLYDSSVYPIGIHDVYGIAGAEAGVHRLANGLVEFPLSTATVFGRRIPFGGGGYFRFYPMALTRRLIRHANAEGRPVMFYIHPYEAGPVVPEVAELPWLRRLRHYYRSGRGGERLASLVRTSRFAPVAEVLRLHHAL